MAESLPTDNVTKLPTRAARGAGKSKPNPEPARMKPEVPKSKVRSPDESAREAAMTKLVGWRLQHQKIDVAISALQEEIKELTAEKKSIRGAISSVVPLAVFDEGYNDARQSRTDLVKKEEARKLVREAFGLATGSQADLLSGVPDGAKGGVYWEAQGYQDGIAGGDAVIPEGCPPENGQDYLRGHMNAMTIAALGLAAVEELEQAAGDDALVDASDDDGGDEKTTDEAEGEEPEAKTEIIH